MAILTLDDAAPFLGVKNGRAVRRLIRLDPTIPFAKKGRRWLAVEEDLLVWVRSGYSEQAKRLLGGTPIPDEATESAARELDERLATHPARRRRRRRPIP